MTEAFRASIQSAFERDRQQAIDSTIQKAESKVEVRRELAKFILDQAKELQNSLIKAKNKGAWRIRLEPEAIKALSELDDFSLNHELIGTRSQNKQDGYLQATYQTSLPGIYYQRQIYLNKKDKPEEVLLVTNLNKELPVQNYFS
jgi:hypothetical protein